MRRFLADASYELRTPIAALQATIETLLRERPPRPRRDQFEAEAARGTQRLGRLVDDLLNLARLESNEPLRSEAVDLARALRNLLDNAVRAGGEDGCIRVELQRSPARVCASVSDDGPGVPPGARERIFDRFVRLDGSAGAGTGLGLAIARAIAEQHHGRVTCEDCEAGARFTLEMPATDLTPVSQH
jgi:two-component system, OmpR family, sensor kinase